MEERQRKTEGLGMGQENVGCLGLLFRVFPDLLPDGEDELTHARPDRQTRDDEVEAILRAAGLPVVRVLTSRTHDTRELAGVLAPYP